MKLFTKSTDYAIRALVALAKNKRNYLSSRKLALSEGIPYQFLRRILAELIRAGMIVSQEGGRGGVKIAIDPLDINVAGIVKIFQGKLGLSDCMFRKSPCSKRLNCQLRPKLKHIEKIIEEEFKKITLSKLMED